jgi:hypothetical protein
MARNKTQLMHTLNDLRARGRMSWIEAHYGWCAAPNDLVDALSKDGVHSVSASRQRAEPSRGERETWRSSQSTESRSGIICSTAPWQRFTSGSGPSATH